MNPIINPLQFYLIGISNSLIVLSVFIGSCALIVAIILGCVGGIVYTDGNKNAGCKILNYIKKYVALGILTFSLAAILPSEKTCYKMIAATIVTPNNIELVGNTATDIIDYIIESVDTLIEKEKEKE